MEIRPYTQKVRPYTSAERIITTPNGLESPTDKLERRIHTQKIDETRYADALHQYPELGSHLESQAAIGHACLERTASIVGATPTTVRTGDFEVRPTMPFDGTESPVTAFVSREVDLARYHLPAA